ncbi:hypothetical protein GA0070216_10537 [Micromonospora matsumotoense]|uniref:Uncharacterized protein n=1 Tax=Micromonospora matsumotoense TaxID=121616 RepID=A0A1C4XMN5_9ACTN|nr:hypothetical protein [Micromonospora matsumotoense]SCF09673.1 hypothetical protein GA0070216_10537 [Micromonospora matsumotoense]
MGEQMISRRLRALSAAVAAATVALSIATPAMAAPATGPVLDITSIAFDRPQVDVTEDYAAVSLTWTTTDRAAGAGTSRSTARPTVLPTSA